jgi:mRNA interferase MazF
VNFDPSFGHEYKKVRPALIVQGDAYIKYSNLLTIIPISSKLERQKELDVLVKKDSQNRLMTDSLIKVKQISYFDKRRFIKLIGIITQKAMQEVKENIQLFLDLSSE